jgi:hypothetical protein
MTTSAVSHQLAPSIMLEAQAHAPDDSAGKLIAGELAMSEVTSERAAKRARGDDAALAGEHAAKHARQDDILLAPPSGAAKVPQELERIIASVVDGSHDTVKLSPAMQEIARRQGEVAPAAARMLAENPSLNPLELLDQLDPMLAQSVTATVGARATPVSTEPAAKRDTEATPAASGKGGAPSVSASMDRLRALIAILILSDLLRDQAKEDQAAQLRLNVASTKISAEQLVSAAKANVAGAAAGLTLTAGMAGVGTMKVLKGNKDTRASIDKNLTAANNATKKSNAVDMEARKLRAEGEVAGARPGANGSGTASGPKQPDHAMHLQDLDETRLTESARASELQATHGRNMLLAQDKIAIGQAVMQGAASASQLAMQGGFYAGSMRQQASTLAKSDADVAQGTADTERDAAAAHTEVGAKMLQILQAIARQEFERNSTIVTARAA